MKRPYQHRLGKRSTIEIPAVDSGIAVIHKQYLRLDPDEQWILRRILRQAERLDAALADLHLFLPVVEICFYGVGTHGRRFSVPRLRKLIRRWGEAGRVSSRENRVDDR